MRNHSSLDHCKPTGLCGKTTWGIKHTVTNSYQHMARENPKHGLGDFFSFVINIICNIRYVQ